MVIKNQHIPFVVKRVSADQPLVTSVYFERPRCFTFDAGDWIDIEFEGNALSGGKTYSISSSPTEDDIRITFKNGLSQYKNALQTLRPNDTVVVSQYGNDYDFALDTHRSSTLIAGGIGIAPFRSMLKERFDTGDKNDIQLIYLNQTDTFLFEEELNQWSRASNGLTIEFIMTKELNRKKREKTLLSSIRSLNRNFYIAGPPSMVEATEHLLIDNGVPVSSIRIDSFGGY